MVRIVTKELREKLIRDRKKGMPYSEIMKIHNVSKWICINYLKQIPVNKRWIEEAWKKAEEEAEPLLIKRGFKHIINLNKICPSPHWDYYAEKNGKWLIDVTINGKKSIVEKYSRILEGYNCAILHHHDNGEWSFVQIQSKKL